MRPSQMALIAATAAVLISACAKATPSPVVSPAAVPDTVVMVDTVRVTVESPADAEMEARVGLLEIQLLERDVRLEQMQEQLDVTRQEVVRNLAKLQSQANRAEAASGMSESEIALQALGRVPGGEELLEFSQAEAMIAESATQFANENYGGALYLSTQARTLARAGQSRFAGTRGESMRAGETRFATSVPLQTTQRANIRSGPGLSFDVLVTLDEATPLVGHSYTSQWIRAVDEQGREGWVFHTLVAARAR
jgi:hypothetical protein